MSKGKLDSNQLSRSTFVLLAIAGVGDAQWIRVTADLHAPQLHPLSAQTEGLAQIILLESPCLNLSCVLIPLSRLNRWDVTTVTNYDSFNLHPECRVAKPSIALSPHLDAGDVQLCKSFVDGISNRSTGLSVNRLNHVTSFLLSIYHTHNKCQMIPIKNPPVSEKTEGLLKGTHTLVHADRRIDRSPQFQFVNRGIPRLDNPTVRRPTR